MLHDAVLLADGGVQFRHPLLRSVAYALAPAAERRAAHAALAEALAAEPGDDRRAWHRAAAAVVPDEEIAGELADAAERATRRSGHVAAARALETAARLTPSPATRGRRLIAAAEAARRAARIPWARELLAAADPLVDDRAARGELEFAHAIIEAWSGSTAEAQRRYVAVARTVVDEDPDRAALALSHAAAASLVAGHYREALATARDAMALDERAPLSERTRTIAIETLGNALLLCGETEAGAELVERSAAWFERSGELAGRQYVAVCLGWLEDLRRARELVEPTVAAARRTGDLRTVTSALEVQAEIDYRAGHWQAAYAAAAESARLADETGQVVQHAYSLRILALVEAAQGHEASERHALHAQETARRHGLGFVTDNAQAALGLRELGAGRPAEALEHLLPVAERARSSGLLEPAVVQWAGDLLDALIYGGREAEARAAVEELQAQAERTGRVWARAVAARARGLLADAAGYDAAFAEALRWHEQTTAPFERGRTELCWGQRLRRDRRRVAAREHLRAAAEIFERLGASPWLEMARRELGASGETLRARDVTAADVLTAQELQVALIVGEGASNKDAAAQLFLSTKTIESHLSSIYRKLGVRSRVQLAHRLG